MPADSVNSTQEFRAMPCLSMTSSPTCSRSTRNQEPFELESVFDLEHHPARMPDSRLVWFCLLGFMAYQPL